MQYRVQSSVTEERLVRPTPQEPSKSYTPLNALSCMLPPGNESGEFFSHLTRPYLCLVNFRSLCPIDLLDPHGTPSSSSGLPPPPMPQPDCVLNEPSYRYPPLYAQPPHQHLIQPPPPPIHHASSAFCPMPPQVHHDPTGKSIATLYISFYTEPNKTIQNTVNPTFFTRKRLLLKHVMVCCHYFTAKGKKSVCMKCSSFFLVSKEFFFRLEFFGF